MRYIIALLALALYITALRIEDQGITDCQARGHSQETCLAAFGIK